MPMMISEREAGRTGDSEPPPPSAARSSPPSPLLRRFPALATIPRALLGDYPTPVERLPVAEPLWIKRDDLSALELGGNKVRALEFLLGGLSAGDEVLTVGGEGSTHVLATAVHAARLGIRASAIRWRHDMNPGADAVARRSGEVQIPSEMYGGPLRGLARGQLARLGARVTRFIPLGGTSPLGVLGHVNAGLELAEQVVAKLLPAPEHVVVPLGTGGTAAGLALGFRIAGLRTIVVGARVAPLIGSNRWRVLRVARRAAQLIARHTGQRIPVPGFEDVRVVHDFYGGAYGRPSAAAAAAAQTLHELTGIRLDGTYSAKAYAAALSMARYTGTPTLFWLTFDGRWLGEAEY
ncbi:MAG: pyridoxal-phosphate dependent enzyme [Gemmatimonadota bacterium]|nr:pyridoxal-phosphate dependent enzyme [Gemmatimonadota bacterium]